MSASLLAGPSTLVVTIPGEPVPKGRPRFSHKTGRAITPERTVAAESIVAWHVKQAACEQGIELPFAGNVYLLLGFGSTAKAGQEPDIDNLVKLVFDALNGVAYADDRQVVMLMASLGRRDIVGDQEPWTAIAIRQEAERWASFHRSRYNTRNGAGRLHRRRRP